MKKEELKQMAEDPRFIPGIYNYCDRWCERCEFTSRCLNYEMSEEKFGDPETMDPNNRVFWEKLKETLQESLSLLKEMATEKGIDLEAIDVDVEEEAHVHGEDSTVVHIISHMAKSYINLVDNWFDADIYQLEFDEEDVDFDPPFDPSEAWARKHGERFKDAVEVIRWYQHFIYVKLQRALKSRQDEIEEDPDDFPKDSDGSAKVALIGIDRSISAWGESLKLFPSLKDYIVNIMAHLKRLANRVEAEFPAARDFIRPGLDEQSP